MKRIGDLVKSLPSTESEQPVDSTFVKTLWLRMTEIYGHKWSSSYGETPSETWSRGISALSREQLKEGLRGCMASGNAWPPSLPEFLAMCKPPKRENAAAYRWTQALPAPVTSKETARAKLAELLKGLS